MLQQLSEAEHGGFAERCSPSEPRGPSVSSHEFGLWAQDVSNRAVASCLPQLQP